MKTLAAVIAALCFYATPSFADNPATPHGFSIEDLGTQGVVLVSPKLKRVTVHIMQPVRTVTPSCGDKCPTGIDMMYIVARHALLGQAALANPGEIEFRALQHGETPRHHVSFRYDGPGGTSFCTGSGKCPSRFRDN